MSPGLAPVGPVKIPWLLLAGLASGCGVVSGNAGGTDGGGDGLATGDAAPALTAITKVDLLFDVDNSPSMGDMRAFLAVAVPDLVTRLVQPNCLRGTSIVAPSVNGACPAGSRIEFAPVHDLHVGIIDASLGPRGVTGAGEVCSPTQMTNAGLPFLDGSPAISSHTDDGAHLLNRVPNGPVTNPLSGADLETETTTPDMGRQSFLDWFPTGPGVNAGKSATTGAQALSPPATPIGGAAQLETDFQAMIVGLHYYGCGIGSPIESWYRFLVQPDPYEAIVVGSNGLAQWSGVDATLIQQRHDFLRPDSLVVIVSMSDKDDQEIDVRSFGGQGYKFLDQTFTMPERPSPCVMDPSSEACKACSDEVPMGPDCMRVPAPDDVFEWRTIHMQQRYGLDAQFPLGRYMLGLTSPKVPDRDHEYPPGANCYQGGVGAPGCPAIPPTTINDADLDCTNPLFAATLPDGSDLTPAALCNTAGAGGPRTPDLVYYVHIGGVPQQLLQSTPGDSTGLCSKGTNSADCPPKTALLPSDWVEVLGEGWESPPGPPGVTNPNQYNYMGIDPHMIEAFAPRPGVMNDWVTGSMHTLPSLEYACIFPLPSPMDCSNLMDYATQEACDCSTPGLPVAEVPPVCGLNNPAMPYAMGTNDYTTQYYAKAYPTIREIEVARLLGSQGSISSLCPIHTTDNAAGTDPLFGYRTALAPVVDRLRSTR
jgi:hypothetical protein